MNGNGTQGSPYLVYDVYDLLELGNVASADAQVFIKLMNDIDLSKTEYKDNFPGIRTNGVEFYIHFDGQNYSIKNLTRVSTGQVIGLFYCFAYGTIKNLKLENVYLSGGSWVVALVSQMRNASVKSYIENVHISGSLTTTADVAVFTTACYNIEFNKCSANMFISAGGSVSGFCTATTSGNVYFINCISMSNMTGYGAAGFLTGSQHYPVFVNCTSACQFTQASSMTGSQTFSVGAFKNEGSGWGYESVKIYFSYAKCRLAKKPTVPYRIYGLTNGASLTVASSFYDKDILLSDLTEEDKAGIITSDSAYGVSTEQLKDKDWLIKQGWCF